jgi:imidazole glycerol-phosphate synthase subunit HisH
MVVVVDYGLGNLFSVAKAFEHIGAEVRVSAQPSDIRAATHIVLPGIGAFPQGMKNLQKSGLIAVLKDEVMNNKKPFLGICLGMQLLAQKGYEHEECEGLGWVEGEVRELEAKAQGLRVPHIGWNNLSFTRESALFKGVKTDSDFYFVHSFELRTSQNDLVATTAYGGHVTAAIERDNIWAVQFHPEKSQDAGLQILENFLSHA